MVYLRSVALKTVCWWSILKMLLPFFIIQTECMQTVRMFTRKLADTHEVTT